MRAVARSPRESSVFLSLHSVELHTRCPSTRRPPPSVSLLSPQTTSVTGGLLIICSAGVIASESKAGM